MNVAELMATLSLDSTQFDAGLKNAQSKMGQLVMTTDANTSAAKSKLADYEGAVSTAQQVTQNLFGSFTAANVISDAIRSITDEIIELGKQALQLSSDLAEMQNVTDVTFGENASAVNMWSKTTADSIGISEVAAKEYAGTVGNLFKGMGMTDDELFVTTTQFVERAADMASFFNTDVRTMVDKMMSGVEGSAKPLRDYGIDMTVGSVEDWRSEKGITTPYSDLSTAEKQLARWEYLEEKTAEVQGDYFRTQDTIANQQKKNEALKEEWLSSIETEDWKNILSLEGELLDLLTPEHTIMDELNDLTAEGADNTQKYAALMAEETRIAREKAQADAAELEYQNALNQSREKGEEVAKAYGLTFDEYVAALTGSSTAEIDALDALNRLTSARVSASEETRELDTEFRSEVEGYTDLRTTADKLARQYETDSANFEKAAASVEGYTATMSAIAAEAATAAGDVESVGTAADAITGGGVESLTGALSGASGQAGALESKLNALDGKQIDITVNIHQNGSIPSISGGNTKGDHETGFGYVPYNNYATTLDEGEMVLTKAQATEYRNGNKSGSGGVDIDYTRIGEEVARAMQGFSININGKRAATLMQRNIRDTQSALKRRKEMGYGR